MATFHILTGADDNIFCFERCLDSPKGLKIYSTIKEKPAKDEQ